MSGQQESDRNKMSVEYKPSETAMGAATLRALAALDEREEIRGPDYLAEIFLTEDRIIMIYISSFNLSLFT